MRLIFIAGIVSMLFLLSAAVRCSAEGLAKPVLSASEMFRLGEKMYREGILPNGEKMQAFVNDDVPVSGAFTCVSCHLRGGLGSKEGKVFTPPANGNSLFRPLRTYYGGVEISGGPPRRPAYTDESLAVSIRGGVDSSGRTMHDVMPRYQLNDEDMAILICYLKELSSEFSPGVTGTTLHFATVIADDVSIEERDAMLAPLEDYVQYRNNTAKAYGVDTRQSRMAEVMQGSRDTKYLNIALSRWVLKGPSTTWRSQLEDYYRREPAFALLGGITRGEWKPVHEFSEENRIPCLFPLTDFPVISETDWYTLYLSKGYYQEGEGAARYLGRNPDLLKEKPVVEIVNDTREGRALSAGFQKAWVESGHKRPVTIKLHEGQKLTSEFLASVIKKENPGVVLLWDGPEALASLEALSGNSGRKPVVFASAGYLGKKIWTIRDDLRDTVYLTYPYRLPQDEARFRFEISFVRKRVAKDDAQGVFKRMYPVLLVLAQALTDMRGNYYRDTFLDVISMMPDRGAPFYERLSFGPGQRYASKGCNIVQLSKGVAPELVRKSEWLTY